MGGLGPRGASTDEFVGILQECFTVTKTILGRKMQHGLHYMFDPLAKYFRFSNIRLIRLAHAISSEHSRRLVGTLSAA